MKVVHIITGLNNGGAEGVLYRLVTNDSSNEHIVISMMGTGKYGSLLLDKGVEVHCLDMQMEKIPVRSIIELYKYLKSIDPDIVQTWMYHADLIGGLTAKSLGIKKIFWNIRQSNFDENYTKSRTIRIAKLNAKLSKFIPQKIISCAEIAVQIHKNIGYDEEKIIVIGNGYDFNTFKIDNEARASIRRELGVGYKPVLGMIARFDPQKNHRGLIESLSIVKKKGYDFDLLLVGKDINYSNTALVNSIERYQLSSNVHLLDQRSDISSVMNALDIHILSSAYGEGFPNVVAEAMACGTPCISTETGDSKFIIDDFGLITTPNDTDELASNIIKFLELMKNDKQWNELRTNASQHIHENFSIEKMVRNYKKTWLSEL